MLTLSSIELNTWIAALLWPLSRILGLIAAAPLFGNAAVPASVKVTLGALLAMIIAPTVPALPAVNPMSLPGLLILTQEMLVGLAMGFSIRIVFAAVEMAGELSSLTMGLGFASFFDPQTKGRSSAISQFLVMLATLMFLTVNGHLVLLAALAESFVSLPISASPISGGGFQQLAAWGGEIFRSGLQIVAAHRRRPAADQRGAGHLDARRAAAEHFRYRLSRHSGRGLAGDRHGPALPGHAVPEHVPARHRNGASAAARLCHARPATAARAAESLASRTAGAAAALIPSFIAGRC